MQSDKDVDIIIPHTLGNYAHELARLMEQVVLVSSVAGLGNQIYRSRNEFALQSSSWDFELNTEELQKVMAPIKAEKEEAKAEHQARQQQEGAVYQDDQRHSSGLLDLLERWEEPDSARQDRVRINAVLSICFVLPFIMPSHAFHPRKRESLSVLCCNSGGPYLPCKGKIPSRMRLVHVRQDKSVVNQQVQSMIS